MKYKQVNQYVREYDLNDVLAELSKTPLKKEVKLQDFLDSFKSRHRNWIKKDKMRVHSGWYPDFIDGVIREHQIIWQDLEQIQYRFV